MAKSKPVNPAPKIKIWYDSHLWDFEAHAEDPDYIPEKREYEVEVLSIHFEKNTMRVRFPEGTWGSTDIPATAFFEQMQMIAK